MGITSFKLYLAYPDRLQVDDATIRAPDACSACWHGALVTLHCENGGAIEELRREALAVGRTGVIEHARTRPAVLEGEAVGREPLLQRSRARPSISSTSRPHRLWRRCAPARSVAWTSKQKPARSTSTSTQSARGRRRAVRFRLHPAFARPVARRGASGRAWHAATYTRSRQTIAHSGARIGAAGVAGRPGGVTDFTDIPGGLPGIETRLALVWQGVRSGRITTADWVRLCSEAPARTFGLWPAKGSLAVGADADVVVWAPQRRQSLNVGRP